MPLTNYRVVGTRVYPDGNSNSGWTATADVILSWDCVPPESEDADYEAEVRAWAEHLLGHLP
jgi:hypothetical protein